MSYFELRDGLRKLNILDELSVYYKIEGLDLFKGLRLVNSDTSVLEMFEMNKGHGM